MLVLVPSKIIPENINLVVVVVVVVAVAVAVAVVIVIVVVHGSTNQAVEVLWRWT